MLLQILGIAALGTLGVLTRYGVDLAATRFVQLPFPIGTFGINVLGSFLAGFLYAWGSERGMIPVPLRAALMIGFLGGFTTFSAYSLQSARLFEEGQRSLAIAYLTLSPLLGLLAALGGLRMGR